MKKTLVAVAMMAAGFGLVGCDEADENGELCAYYVQQDMNNQDYDAAIERLSQQSCQDSYPNSTYLIDLGTAFMARAGTSMPDILAAMLDNNGDDAFQSFATSLVESQTDTALTDLKAANEYLTGFDGAGDALEDTKDGVKLVSSFVSLAQTTSAINNLVSGNLESWIDAASGDLSLERSTCALETILGAGSPACASGDGIASIDSSGGTVSFSNSFSTSTYQPHVVEDNNGVEQTFLESQPSGHMILTNGYCSLSGNVRLDYQPDASYYPCPVDGTSTLDEYLEDTLNAGLDNIVSVVNSIDSLDADQKQDILDSISEFETEIGGGSDIDITELLDYLN